MWRPGGWEIIAILVVVLILFGPKQLPKLGKMFGKTMKDLKEGMEAKDEDETPQGDHGGRSPTPWPMRPRSPRTRPSDAWRTPPRASLDWLYVTCGLSARVHRLYFRGHFGGLLP